LSESHRRGCSRLRLGIPARLENLDGRQNVRLIDLSQSGARLLTGPQHPFKSAVISWLGFEAFGDVAWQKGSDVGIQFEELIPLEWVIATRDKAPDVVRTEALGAQAAARDWVAGTLGSTRA
jgi:hypothetical protein